VGSVCTYSAPQTISIRRPVSNSLTKQNKSKIDATYITLCVRSSYRDIYNYAIAFAPETESLQDSVFGIVESQFCTKAFTVHRSPFTVHHSPFAVRRSPFGVWRLAFGVRRSPTFRGPNFPLCFSRARNHETICSCILRDCARQTANGECQTLSVER
jgi:hypothetical protein